VIEICGAGFQPANAPCNRSRVRENSGQFRRSPDAPNSYESGYRKNSHRWLAPFRSIALLILLFASTTSHAAQPDFQATADVLTSRQQTIVKLFGAGSGNLDSYGSGTLVSADGHFVTVWNHLISTGFLTAITADGRKYSVDVVGTSAEHDLALLKLRSEPGDQFAHIDLTKIIDSAPGTPILAFSNMFHVATGNEPVSIVHGVIAVRIPLEATQGRWKFPLKSSVWLIDAITNNSGAAGGLLTDTSGVPIGLIGREIRHSASRTWVNYAVPLTTLKPVIESLLAGKKVDSRPKDADASLAMISDQELTAKFGVTMLPDVVERTPAWIDAVTKDSIAAKAGLQRGDLIVMVNDAVITSVTDFQQQLATYRSGERVALTINRDQQLLPVDLRIP
jgi:serine protease Do